MEEAVPKGAYGIAWKRECRNEEEIEVGILGRISKGFRVKLICRVSRGLGEDESQPMDNRWRFLYCGMTELVGTRKESGSRGWIVPVQRVPATLQIRVAMEAVMRSEIK